MRGGWSGQLVPVVEADGVGWPPLLLPPISKAHMQIDNSRLPSTTIDVAAMRRLYWYRREMMRIFARMGIRPNEEAVPT